MTSGLEVLRRGTGDDVVVLLHAVGLDAHAWGPLADRLAAHRSVVAPSLRGHGRSPAPVGAWSIGNLATDVHRMLAEHGWARAHVVGLSLGGMVAQQLALDHPEDVGSLVLISTAAGFDEPMQTTLRDRGRRAMAAGMAAVVDETLDRWSIADGNPLYADLRRTLLADDPGAWARTWEAVAAFDVRRRLAEVRQPALVLGGGRDGSTPPAMLEAIANGLADAHLQIEPDAGHMAPLEHPLRYASLIEAFIDASRTAEQNVGRD